MKYLVFLLFIPLSFFSQEKIVDTTEVAGWKKSGKSSFLINQTAFSNWVSGGENSIAGTLSVDYDINYYKNEWSWDTKIIGSFGVNKNSDSNFLKKIDDRIEINSVIAKEFIDKFSFSGFLNFKTQFARGFQYSTNEEGDEIRNEKTRIFSPAYTQLGAGVYWKESNALWVNFAPITARLILVNKKFTNDLDDGEDYFGVPGGQNSRFELGASVSAFYEFELVKNISLEQSINLFSDYLHKANNVDLDYILTFNMKINDYLTTTLIVEALYDNNAVKRIQLREVFGLAFVINI